MSERGSFPPSYVKGSNGGKNRVFELFREHGATSGSLNKLLEPCDPKVIKAMRDKGYTIHVAKKGTDEYRYLVNNNIEASFNNAVGLEKHILIREGATKSAVLEEFLHSVQNRIPSLKNKSPLELEVHVKEFMIRHAKILGLESEADLGLLRQLRIEEISRINESFGRKP